MVNTSTLYTRVEAYLRQNPDIAEALVALDAGNTGDRFVSSVFGGMFQYGHLTPNQAAALIRKAAGKRRPVEEPSIVRYVPIAPAPVKELEPSPFTAIWSGYVDTTPVVTRTKVLGNRYDAVDELMSGL